MAQLLIRNVPEETVAFFKARAQRNGNSLEQEIRDLLEASRTLTAEERIAFSRKIRSRTRRNDTPLTLDEIREGLE
ncbi:FitA-like ribbon-helix-helix domain-containing protein [Xanthobacteraceae bacterium A53D]